MISQIKVPGPTPESPSQVMIEEVPKDKRDLIANAVNGWFESWQNAERQPIPTFFKDDKEHSCQIIFNFDSNGYVLQIIAGDRKEPMPSTVYKIAISHDEETGPIEEFHDILHNQFPERTSALAFEDIVEVLNNSAEANLRAKNN